MKHKPPTAATTSKPAETPSDRQKRDKARASLVELFTSVSPVAARELLQNVLPQQQLIHFMGQFFAAENFGPGLAKWSEKYLRFFESFNIEPDLQRLVGLGIRREIIAIAMISINRSQIGRASCRERV